MGERSTSLSEPPKKGEGLKGGGGGGKERPSCSSFDWKGGRERPKRGRKRKEEDLTPTFPF